MDAANPYSAPAAALESDQKICHSCGAAVKKLAEICPKCGVRQHGLVNKPALLLITFFLGGLGAHKFYLGKWVQGIFYLLFFWLWIPGLIALIEFIIYACTSSERLNEKYSTHGSAAVIMIVGALVFAVIVGILAAIAIPAFQDYQYRGKMAETLMGLSAHKDAVNEYFAEKRQLPVSGVEVKLPAVPVSRTQSVNITRGGAIVARLSGDPDARFAGKAIILVPRVDGESLTWTCGVEEQPMARYLLASCRTVLPLP